MMEIIIGFVVLFILAYFYGKFVDLLDSIFSGIFGFISGKYNDSLDEYEKKKNDNK